MNEGRRFAAGRKIGLYLIKLGTRKTFYISAHDALRKSRRSEVILIK